MSTVPALPPPRISDDEVARLPVDAALAALLDELLGVDAPKQRRRWPVGVSLAAVAASVAAALAVPALLADDARSGPTPAPPANSGPTSPAVEPTPPTDPEPTGEAGPEVLAPQRPAVVPWDPPPNLALLEADGWTIDPTLVNSSRNGFGISYARGNETFELQWERSRFYAGRVRDAEREPGSGTLRVLGVDAVYVTYDSQQQMAYLPELDGWGLRVAAAFTTPDDVPLPRDAAARRRPGRHPRRHARLGRQRPTSSRPPSSTCSSGTEVPEGYAPPTVTGWMAPYHVAASIVTDVACAWAAVYATEVPADQARALAALEGSPRWPLLVEPPVAWPEWLEDMTKAMRRGEEPGDVLNYEGCPGGTTLPRSIS